MPRAGYILSSGPEAFSNDRLYLFTLHDESFCCKNNLFGWESIADAYRKTVADNKHCLVFYGKNDADRILAFYREYDPLFEIKAVSASEFVDLAAAEMMLA